LDDYRNCQGLSPTLELIRLIASNEQQTMILARNLAERRDEFGPDGLDFIETILVYKLPRLSREEIKTMLALNEIELKQTRFYQEVVEEGRQEECISLVTRLLRRKFGIQFELEQLLAQLQILPVEKLEDLIEAIFDWAEPSDLTEWLRQQLAEINRV
jgi:predicted transposase YdaD